MAVVRNTLIGTALQFAAGLRFPTLFAITGALFLLDLLIPDFIPFADELLLGLATLVLASWKRRAPPASS
jgi:Family of unknown function (DUF6116)